MALTKATLIDLNANELILDLDADTSITADTDDTIHIKIGGSDEITITGTALSPSTSDGSSLGTSALEWSDLFLADGAVINFGDDQDVSLTHVADTGLLLSSTDQLQFGDSGTYIHQSADGVLDLVSDTEIEINATTIDINGNVDISGTITIGSAAITEAELETIDGITAGTVIASKAIITDANKDITGGRNITISGELDAATGDFSGDVDIDGTANLDVVDIDGATQIDATVTVGVNDTGYDVKFFGATSGAYMLWDESVDDLILAGAARAVVPDGNLVLGSTAVTSTAAELNLLDGVSGLVQADLTKLAAIDATAAEINLIDGGTARGTTAVADADGILHNDDGTMRMTSAATFKTYFQEGISTAYDDLTAGDAAVLITTSSGNITIDAAANDSDIIFKGTDGGADTTFLTIDGSAAGAATFNDKIIATELDISGNMDIDGTSNLDVVDIDGAVDMASTLQVDGAITSSAGATITVADNTDNLSLISTDADANSGPNLRLYRNSGSPADDDVLGQLDFEGRNNNSQDVVYSQINSRIMSTTDGSEDGNLYLKVMKSGTLREAIMCDRTEVVVNNDSVDMDFRVESDSNTHAFFVQGSDGNVGIGVVPEPTYSTWQAVQIAGTGNLFGERSQAANQQIVLGQNVYMDAGGDFTHLITDEASYYRQYAGTHAFFIAPSGSADATLSTTKALEIKNNGQTHFAVNDNVAPMGTFEGSYDGGDSYVNITNNYGGSSSTDEKAGVNFNMYNNTVAIYGYKVDDGTSGAARDAGLQFWTQDSNSLVNRFQISNNGTLLGQDTSIGSLSDQRLKENIADLTYSLDTFKALKPKTFTWKNTAEHPGDGTRRGFIAQDLVGVDPYWTEEHKAEKLPDQLLEAATYYEEGDTLPSGKNIGDVKTAATYTYQYAKGDGSDYDLLDDGSELANKFLAAKLGKKDAMYVSVIKQLITKIETLETKVQALEDA